MNPRKMKPFIVAYEEKQKTDYKRIDYTAWLNGLYVMRAIGAAFSDKVEYFEKPQFSKADQDQLEPESNDEAAAAGFAAYAAAFNKQFEKGGDSSGN